MTTNKAMAAKAKKIAAYKELLKIEQDGSFERAYHTQIGRGPLAPLKELERLPDDRCLHLNQVLNNLAAAETFSPDHEEEERRVIRLVLDAGANPNCHHYGDGRMAIFDYFVRHYKYHGALEIAKTAGFVGPENQQVFELLASFSSNKDKSALVKILFDKEMYPYNPEIRQLLQPLYEAEKKKEIQQGAKKTRQIEVPKHIEHGDEAMEFIRTLDDAYARGKNSKLVFGPGSFPRDERGHYKSEKRTVRGRYR